MTEPKTDQPSRSMLDQEIAQMLDQDAPMAQAFARVATIDRRRHEQATRNLSVDVAAMLTHPPAVRRRWTTGLGIAVPSLAVVAVALFVIGGQVPEMEPTQQVIKPVSASIGNTRTSDPAPVLHTTTHNKANALTSMLDATSTMDQDAEMTLIADLADDHLVDQLINADANSAVVVPITETEIDNLFVGI